jgi:hypothetical protein
MMKLDLYDSSFVVGSKRIPAVISVAKRRGTATLFVIPNHAHYGDSWVQVCANWNLRFDKHRDRRLLRRDRQRTRTTSHKPHLRNVLSLYKHRSRH